MTTTASTSPAGILLVDDGELDQVAEVLESEGLDYERMRGGSIPAEIAPPHELLIVTPRRVDRVRRGSPADASPGRPLRIIAVQEDSPPMRRRLRQAGLHLLVRLPADAEIWRLLIARALYQGSERREDPRVAVGSRVAIDANAAARPSEVELSTILVDLSNRGCRLQTRESFSVGDPVAFTLPSDQDAGSHAEPLTLRGSVRRIASEAGAKESMLAVVFDTDMSDENRTRLTALINRWASGPGSLGEAPETISPAIPPCQLPSLPELTLDDETDPPVPARSEIHVHLAEVAEDPAAGRRSQPRGRFESTIVAEGQDGPVVLIGRDLSAGGMRIERIGLLRLGDRFRMALHGPTLGEPFVVHAEITRDDGDDGFALVFDEVDPVTAIELEKLVACLPDVESLDAGEIGGLGAILSEILPD